MQTPHGHSRNPTHVRASRDDAFYWPNIFRTLHAKQRTVSHDRIRRQPPVRGDCAPESEPSIGKAPLQERLVRNIVGRDWRSVAYESLTDFRIVPICRDFGPDDERRRVMRSSIGGSRRSTTAAVPERHPNEPGLLRAPFCSNATARRRPARPASRERRVQLSRPTPPAA